MTKPNVLFDVDGVIADFVRGAFKHHGVELDITKVQWDFPSQIGFAGREHEFWNPLGYFFWSGLPVLGDGKHLLAAVEEVAGLDRVSLLSSPCETHGCCDGKRAWVREHFPRYSRKLFLGNDKSSLANPHTILIDDNEENCQKFIDAGGVAILLPRPWNHKRWRCFNGVFNSLEVIEEFCYIYEMVEKECR